MKLRTKDLLTLNELSKNELLEIINNGIKLKKDLKRGIHKPLLKNKTLAMIFQKPSTRTRVSFEAGMYQLGGHALFLGADAIQLNRGETVPDTAKVLSRFVDGIMARVFAHQDIMDLARHATVPVINGLSDLLHPCQALAAYFTLLERRGSLDGLKIAYVGDGNNVCHELMFGAVKLGMAMSVASPAGYEPNQLIVKSAAREAQKGRTPAPEVMSDPREAVRGADAVYTDVWTSMGQEEESEARRAAFEGYIVDQALMSEAKPDAVFMHCLPAHRGEEVAAEVMDGPQSIVFDEAGGRLDVQE